MNKGVKMTRRQKAILKRRIFIIFCAAVLAITAFFIGFIINSVFSADKKQDASSSEQSSDYSSSVDSNNSSDSQSKVQSSTDNSDNFTSEDTVIRGDYKLDANFSMLLLVNADNPLPDTYDSEVRKDLV